MAADITGAFVRQRRSLMLVSIILSIVMIYGIKGEEVRLSPGAGSVTVNFGGTGVIYLGLWAAWCWFIYRYWQHFLVVRTDELAELTSLQTDRVRTIFGPRMLKLGTRLIDKELREMYPPPLKVLPIEKRLAPLPRRVGWRRVEAGVETAGTPVVIKETGRQERASVVSQPIVLKAPWIWPALFRAVLPVNLRHRYFSEYWTAFLFASLPPIAFVYTHAPGWVVHSLSYISTLFRNLSGQ